MTGRVRAVARLMGREPGRRGIAVFMIVVAGVLLTAGCGGSSNTASPRSVTTVAPTTPVPRVPAALASKLATECTDFAMHVSTTDAVLDPVARAAALRPIVAKLRSDLSRLEYPVAVAEVRARVDGSMADAATRLAGATTPSAASSALTAFEHDIDTAGLTLLNAGVNCLGHASALHSAEVTVQLEGDSWLMTSGFGSLWVSEKYLGQVVRVSSSGKVLARIDVGPNPAKLFATDRWIWVRTQTGLVQIDPSANRVVRRAPYAAFGAATQRAWAGGNQLWLCDGGTLVRIDPTSARVVARIPLRFQCFEVFTDGLTPIAWSSDNAPEESGNEQIAIIDPASNRVRATIALPVDIGVPSIVGSRAYLPGDNNDDLIVVDMNTGAIVATRQLGSQAVGSSVAGAGSVWVPTNDGQVLRIDPTTISVRAHVEPVGASSLAVLDNALWTVTFDPLNLAQRFDLEGTG